MAVDLPTEDSDTLGGFIYTELGKVPAVGDRVVFGELDFTVESVSGRRIKKVRVERRPPPALEEPEQEHVSFFHRNGNGKGQQAA
jgi:CBS domain containing-hemolysin-like protein